VRVSVNLKYAARELPADERAILNLRSAISGRPAVLWASTHKGDEAAALRVHAALEKDIAGLLTVIVPRHPSRGGDIAALLRSDAPGTGFTQRSLGGLPAASDGFYLADTLGELGVFFRCIPVVVMGGSLDRIGGHNPVEPAQLGACVLFGPSRHNFEAMVRDFSGAGALVDFADQGDLTQKLRVLLRDPSQSSAAGARARDFCLTRRAQAEQTFDLLRPFVNVFMQGAA
jgi:3-deoxy-D-manno-octulosonic-acid transferase